ncbi:MAG: hypothetical protein ACHREM_31415, partial [Polyangiales bacterium]
MRRLRLVGVMVLAGTLTACGSSGSAGDTPDAAGADLGTDAASDTASVETVSDSAPADVVTETLPIDDGADADEASIDDSETDADEAA